MCVKLVSTIKDDWGSNLQTPTAVGRDVVSVTFSPDFSLLASGSCDRTVKVWDPETGRCLQILEGHENWIISVVFSPDSSRLASGSQDKIARIWDLETGRCLQELRVVESPKAISFDATGACLYINGDAFDLEPPLALDGTHQTTITEPRSQDYGVSSDDEWITRNGENILWLPEQYRPRTTAFAPSRLAFGCDSGHVLIFKFLD